MNSNKHLKILFFLFFFCLITTKSQGATGEIMLDSPVVNDIVAVSVDQGTIEVSGTYILSEDATPDFKGPTEYCSGGIGTLRPRFWDGRDGAPVGYYADLFFRVDGGSRHKIGTVRYGHGYVIGTEYDQLNTQLHFSFSISLKNLPKEVPHEILIELVDIFSLYCKPRYWWYMGYAQKIYGEVITSVSIPFFIGNQTPPQDNQSPDPDPGGCPSNKSLVAFN